MSPQTICEVRLMDLKGSMLLRKSSASLCAPLQAKARLLKLKVAIRLFRRASCSILAFSAPKALSVTERVRWVAEGKRRRRSMTAWQAAKVSQQCGQTTFFQHMQHISRRGRMQKLPLRSVAVQQHSLEALVLFPMRVTLICCRGASCPCVRLCSCRAAIDSTCALKLIWLPVNEYMPLMRVGGTCWRCSMSIDVSKIAAKFFPPPPLRPPLAINKLLLQKGQTGNESQSMHPKRISPRKALFNDGLPCLLFLCSASIKELIWKCDSINGLVVWVSNQMRQIISLHVGQGGIQIGSTCWQLFCLEHGFTPQGFTPQGFKPLQNDLPSSSYFSENEQSRHVPRALFLDLDSEATNSVLSGSSRQLYSQQNIIGRKEDAGSNFARGYQQLGRQSIDCFTDAIRKEADKCEDLQGFLLYSSLGGGTGGGLASLLLEKLSDEYQKCKKMSFSIYPSAVASTSCVEPYNYALSAYFRRNHQNVAVVLDNEALHSICRRNLDIERPAYSNINRVIAQAVSGITAASRFDGCLNNDLSQFEASLVPYPPFKNVLASMAPINRREAGFYEKSSLLELTCQVFEPASQLARCDPRTGKFMACSIAYRGDIIPKDVGHGICNIKTKRTIQFVDWCPTGFKVGITYQPNRTFPHGDMAEEKRSLCMLANSTALAPVLERQDYKFNRMLKKRAFLHWFTSNGLEESLFPEIQEHLASLQRDYKEAEKESEPDGEPEEG